MTTEGYSEVSQSKNDPDRFSLFVPPQVREHDAITAPSRKQTVLLKSQGRMPGLQTWCHPFTRIGTNEKVLSGHKLACPSSLEGMCFFFFYLIIDTDVAKVPENDQLSQFGLHIIFISGAATDNEARSVVGYVLCALRQGLLKSCSFVHLFHQPAVCCCDTQTYRREIRQS